MVASLIASKEVAHKFEERYGNKPGIISRKRKAERLALVTVTSALGRSSLYNRLKLTDSDKTVVVHLQRLGTTIGYGHFQITNDIFSELRQILHEDGHRYANGHQFGSGPNWRIRVAREGLRTLGLDSDAILRHGIKREVYAMPIARNSREFLMDRDDELVFNHRTVEEISKLARDRWVVPRSERRPEYCEFDRDELRDKLTLDH